MALPADWKNCYFVLYRTNTDGTIDSTYVKEITHAQRNTGELLPFYGVRASKYGIIVPKTTEKWGIISMEDSKPELLISGDIIEPNSKQIFELSDGRVIYMKRGKNNLTFSISFNNTIPTFRRASAK
jgi:hypothetical protein